MSNKESKEKIEYIDLNKISEEVIQNRIRRGFPSAHDLSKTTEGLAEELGEWAKAKKHNNKEEMTDALIDIIVFCLGGLRILDVDIHKEIIAVIENNKIRTHTGHH